VHPLGHPYAHPADGLISELNNISLDDARRWLISRHSPAMATLIIAGDVEPAQAVSAAHRYFGSLLRQPVTSEPLAAGEDSGEQNHEQAAGLEHLSAHSQFLGRRTIALPVKDRKLCMEWIGPDFTSHEFPALEVAGEILGGSRASRLRRRLMHAEHLAKDVAIEVRARKSGAQIVLSIVPEVTVPLTVIEPIVCEEIERLCADGPALHELECAQVRIFGKIVRGFERVGGPNSKSDAIGLAAMIGTSVDSQRRRLAALAMLQPEAVATSSRWLAGAGALLEMCPRR
jgi:hypothetical protein